jgi:hypothetical protein
MPTGAANQGRQWTTQPWRWSLVALIAVTLVAACGTSKTTAPPTSTTTAVTTTTTQPATSNLTVDGVRPGVLQAPFYPQITVTQVTCGAAPKGGRFIRINLPPGGAGTPARSVLTKATAVIIVPGAALLIDPRYGTRTLYAEAMPSIATATSGGLVLTLANLVAAGGDGLAVEVGNVQINGDYQCPASDVSYPGT